MVDTTTDTTTLADTAANTDDEGIVEDHSVVDAHEKNPQQYLAIVKTWLVDAAGESHSAAYWDGMNALAALDSAFAVNTFESGFYAASVNSLRLGRHASVGEEDFWTNQAAVADIKQRISVQHETSNPIDVIFQAWCWDMAYARSSGDSGTNDYDPEYGCHWFGASGDGPDGDCIWGIDSGDNAITGNSVSLQT